MVAFDDPPCGGDGQEPCSVPPGTDVPLDAPVGWDDPVIVELPPENPAPPPGADEPLDAPSGWSDPVIETPLTMPDLFTWYELMFVAKLMQMD